MGSCIWMVQQDTQVGDGTYPCRVYSDLRLYIIEGAITIVFGFAIFWLLPDKPEHAYFLNAHDKETMQIRAEQTRLYAGTDKFEWRQVRLAFQDLKLYIRYIILNNLVTDSALCQFGADVCLYGFSTLLPIIIQAMGYGSVEAQYLTIPGTRSMFMRLTIVYLWGAIT